MYVHLVNKMFLVATNDGPFILISDIDGVSTIKFPKNWNNEETKKIFYDLKARNVLIYVLNAKVNDSISHQSLSNALQVLHGGTEDVKESKINKLTEGYEIFRMEPDVTVESMHMLFI